MDEKEQQRRSKEDYYREIREGKAGHLGFKLSKAYSTFMRSGKENQDKIAAITSAAPGNVCAQMLAAKKIKSMSADQLRYYTRTLASMEGINPGDAKQGGFDYFATIEAKAEAEAVAQASMV